MIVNRHVSRLEAFSDAIFGFAATLLVVSTDIPGSYVQLAATLKLFVPFALSFATLVLLWAVHNGFFRRYEIEDTTTIVLNAIFLFLVIFYVYPLRFAMTTAVGFFGASFGMVPITMQWWQLANMFIMYGAGWTAVFACVSLLYLHAYRRRETLGLDPLSAFDAVTQARHYGMFVLAGIISMAIAASGVGIAIGLPGFIFAILGPFCWWNGWSRAKQRERIQGGAAKVAAAPGIAPA
jgi:uncharacterized membrane protein